MRRLIAWSLMMLLAPAAFGRDRTPEEQVRRIKAGAPIEVSLLSGERLTGRMGSVSPTTFVMEPVQADQGKSRTVEYTEVRLVRGTRHAVRHVVLISSVTVAIVVVGCVVILASVFGFNR